MPTARQIVETALVWDQLFPATEICGSWQAHTQMLMRMKTAGFNAVSITAAYDPDDTLAALNRLSHWRKLMATQPDTFTLLRTADDARRAQAEGKLAIGFHFQGTTPFARDIGLVQLFYDMGVRHALLAYNHRNHVASGIHDPHDAGLSGFGRALITEMQRLGMLVDLSHTGLRSAREAFEMAQAPMIFSHANPAALHSHDRNLPDDVARACVATGGMIGLNGVGMFLGPGDRVEQLYRHVDHWCQTVGAHNVGLGLDIVTDPAATRTAITADAARWPADQGYQTADISCCAPECLEDLTDRLLSAGYTDTDCRGILGENWLRLANEVWS